MILHASSLKITFLKSDLIDIKSHVQISVLQIFQSLILTKIRIKNFENFSHEFPTFKEHISTRNFQIKSQIPNPNFSREKILIKILHWNFCRKRKLPQKRHFYCFLPPRHCLILSTLTNFFMFRQKMKKFFRFSWSFLCNFWL